MLVACRGNRDLPAKTRVRDGSQDPVVEAPRSPCRRFRHAAGANHEIHGA